MGSDGHDGKVIVLTGAGAGIGLATTRGLLVQPTLSLVVAVDVNTKELEALLPAHQDRLAVIEGDVSDRSTNQRAIETAVSRRGKLDSVILNAGMLRPVGPAADTKVEEWECLFGVNFFGPVHAIQLALPYLRKANGQVLMTSSGVSLEPYSAWIPYACSKAAMNWLCRCWTKEEDQVSFLCVTPGIVDSGMQAQLRAQYKSTIPPDQYHWLSSLYAEGRLLRPEQPASSFVQLSLHGIPESLNGQVIAWNDARIISGS